MTDWIAGWIARKVEGVSLLENSSPRIIFQTKGIRVPVYAVETSHVEEEHVQLILHQYKDTKFIINASKNAHYAGSALNLCERCRVGLGDLGELMSFLIGGACEYVQREARFVLRSLRQHASVDSVTRANNNMYVVMRRKGDVIQVLVVGDYIVTADSVRTAIDDYGKPHLIAKSNPNGSITDEAYRAASLAGARLVDWSGLLRELRQL